MEKLYRLVGAEGFCLNAMGVRIGVRMNAPGWLARIQAHLPPGWRPQGSRLVGRMYSFVVRGSNPRHGVRRFHLLFGNAQLLARTVNDEELLNAFESDMNMHIAQTSQRRVFVHAGVVGWKGRAIVMPGRSYSGKTTLVKRFLEEGATYYSDEFAVFDGRGYVHPFAKPLAIRDEATQRQIKVPAEEFGGNAGVKPLPVGLFLFTRYRTAARWHPRVMSPGIAALGLLGNALSARTDPDRALAFLGKAVRGAQVIHGVRGEASDVVRAILAS